MYVEDDTNVVGEYKYSIIFFLHRISLNMDFFGFSFFNSTNLTNQSTITNDGSRNFFQSDYVET